MQWEVPMRITHAMRTLPMLVCAKEKRVCAGKLTAPAFESSKAVADHFRPHFTGKRQETVIAVFLNGQNQLLGEKGITDLHSNKLIAECYCLPPLSYFVI